MDKRLLLSKIYPDAEFNPACFDFTEQEARERLLWRDARPMPTLAELSAKQSEADNESAIKAAYDLMVKEVYDEMEVVFGTRNDVSAAAFASTYEAMLKRPENFVDLALGLNDSAAVLAYANAKIISADAYGVFRLKRIAQYQSEKATILGA